MYLSVIADLGGWIISVCIWGSMYEIVTVAKRSGKVYIGLLIGLAISALVAFSSI